MKQTPALVVPFLLAACTATPSVVVEPIEPVSALPVDYVAYLSTTALPQFGPEDFGLVLEDVTDDFPDPLYDQHEDRDAVEGLEVVELACLIVELPRETAWQLLSRCESRLGANLTERGIAEDRFEAFHAIPGVDILNCPRLSLYHGHRGNLTTSNQVAYIESFKLEVSGDGEVYVADPVIGVARDGFAMDLALGTREEGEAIPLDLTLYTSELQRPIVATEGRLPGTATPVTLQLPVFATQRLHLAADLRDDQALVIGAVPGQNPERARLLLVTVDSHVIEDHDEMETAAVSGER